ncbi:hypothetical protein B566_EDAN007905, partial [Ephemera danica]
MAEQERAAGEEVSERLKQASQRLREMERGLQAAKKEVAAKAKKLLREFQQREQDMIHREEFHLQLLQEKDTEYNALVKTLKDRIIQLEQELLETQKAAGLSPQLPYDGNSKHLSPQMSRRHQIPPKPLVALEAEISDTEASDGSPEDNGKVSTVERKVPVKEELDRAVPPHELLDVSASKARVDLVRGGVLAGRQLPTPNKKSPISSSGSSAEEEEESIRVTESHVSMGSLERPVRDRAVLISSSLAERPGSLPGTLQHAHHAVYVSRSSAPQTGAPAPPRSGVGPPPSLAEQLKQVLAERERRISTGEQKDVSDDHKPSTISQSLVEEIRQAVQEANAR